MCVNRLLLSVAVIATAGLSACGTIADGGVQKMDVIVKGSPTAYCTFDTKYYHNQSSYPNTVTFERSRETVRADCLGQENRHVAFEIAPHMTAHGSLGNVVFGVLPGMAYDSLSGGMWEYPNPIIVDFRTVQNGAGPQPEWPDNKVDEDFDATRVGTAPIAPPQPIHMQPIMDEDLNPALSAAPVRLSAPVPVATDKPEVIDAVSLAVDKQKADTAAGKMKPVTSPQDNPAQMKAKAEAAAKEKAKADARRKAAAEARAKAEAAKAKPQTLPETNATAPGEPGQAGAAITPPTPVTETPAATTVTTTTVVAPAATTPAATSSTTTTPPVATTTTTTTTAAPADATPSDATQPAATTTTTTTTTAPADGSKSGADMDKYLQAK